MEVLFSFRQERSHSLSVLTMEGRETERMRIPSYVSELIQMRKLQTILKRCPSSHISVCVFIRTALDLTFSISH